MNGCWINFSHQCRGEPGCYVVRFSDGSEVEAESCCRLMAVRVAVFSLSGELVYGVWQRRGAAPRLASLPRVTSITPATPDSETPA